MAKFTGKLVYIDYNDTKAIPLLNAVIVSLMLAPLVPVEPPEAIENSYYELKSSPDNDDNASEINRNFPE